MRRALPPFPEDGQAPPLISEHSEAAGVRDGPTKGQAG